MDMQVQVNGSQRRGAWMTFPGLVALVYLSFFPAGVDAAEDRASNRDCQDGKVLRDTHAVNDFGRVAVTDESIGKHAPIDIAFVPGGNGAFVVASQGGHLLYYGGGCAATNVIDLRRPLPVDTAAGEQGLLNIEFHPDFATNHFLFFYHTSEARTVNSISRGTVVFDADGGLRVRDIVRIIDFRKDDEPTASNHNGGGMVFAPDGSLLASVGDGGANSLTAQDGRRLLGKVNRILPSLVAGKGGYSIPRGNRFAADLPACSNKTRSARLCPEILAMGLRNPFRMSIDRGIVYLGDVGANYEEINSFAYNRNTLNFGWPRHDGPVNASGLKGYRNPIIAYRREIEAAGFREEDPMATETGSASVIIGAVYRGGKYGDDLEGALLFTDFYDAWVRYVGVVPGADGNGAITDTDSVPGTHLLHAGAITSMVVGPDGALYMTTLYGPAGVYRLERDQ